MKKQDIIDRFGDDLEEVLHGLYLVEKLSTTDIAKYFSEHFGELVSAGTIWMLLKGFNIQLRSISDSVSMATSQLDLDKKYLDKNTIEVLDGLIISDGCISMAGGKYHRFSMASSNKEFADYCFGKLKNVCLLDETKQNGQKDFENGRHASWAFSTGCHPDFTDQYNRWYKDGIKIIPADFIISPKSLLLWYYGDGTLVNGEESNSCVVRFATDAFTTCDIDIIIGRIEKETGIKSVRTSENRIRLKTESIPDFFRYIGRKPELECYSYKFNVADWRFDYPMKKVSEMLKIPYDRLSHLVKKDAIDYSRSPGGKKVVFTEKQFEKLRSENENGLLTSDARINSSAITRNKFNKVPLDIKKKINEIRRNGFPIVSLSEEDIVSEFNNFYNVPMISIYGREFDASYRNNDLAINFHPHLYSVRCGDDISPLDAYKDDKIMGEIIEKADEKNEAICGKNLCKRICSYQGVKRTSVFPIRVAKTLIAKYGKKDMLLLDPCAGYSSRLIGFMGQGYSGKYIGVDPCKDTFNGLNNTFNSLKKMDKSDHQCEIINGCAEDNIEKLEEESFDLIFTSPPYYNLEKYSEEENQSYLRYPTYESWRDNFLFNIINQCKRVLKKDGVFLLNVANARENKIIEDVEKFIKDMFRVEDTLIMHSPSMWSNKISEPIFVLRKE